MKKIYYIIGAVAVLVIAVLTFALTRPSKVDKLVDSAKDVENYYFEGNMEIAQREDTKKYVVKVSYQKIDEQDYFKVSLFDKTLNQEQLIVKNGDGVFVLTPALNQAFQFKSEWPLNSPKPYIYQSLLSIFDGDHDVEKTDDGYIVRADVSYPHNPTASKQEIKFDKSLAPIYVSITDQDDLPFIKVDFTKIDMGQTFGAKDFDVKDAVEKARGNGTGGVSQLEPSYPLEVFGSKLTKEVTQEYDAYTNRILSFSGGKSFTIVESVFNEQDSMMVETVNGEIIDLLDGIAVFSNDELKVYGTNSTISVFSKEMSTDEMLEVVSSMQVWALK